MRTLEKFRAGQLTVARSFRSQWAACRRNICIASTPVVALKTYTPRHERAISKRVSEEENAPEDKNSFDTDQSGQAASRQETAVPRARVRETAVSATRHSALSNLPMLRNLGFHHLPDQSTMAAITFCDVVIFHEPFSNRLYEAIPLEVNAYTVGSRFEGNPAQQFSVADEVQRWIAEGKRQLSGRPFLEPPSSRLCS